MGMALFEGSEGISRAESRILGMRPSHGQVGSNPKGRFADKD